MHVPDNINSDDSYDQSDNSMETEKHEKNEETPINFSIGLTNARSLWQKRTVLADYLEELQLALTIITETWFYDCEALKTLETDLLHGRAVSLLNRCRKKLKRSNPGGGVSIAFKKSLVNLKEYQFKRAGYEVICAKGKIKNHTRPLFVFGVYIPPKSSAAQTQECMEFISEAILKIKTEVRESYIVVGGDLNNRDLTAAIGDYQDLTEIPTDPSRGGAHLDILASNFNNSLKKTAANDPLETEDGQSKSDHAFLSYHFALKHKHDFHWIHYRVRQITDKNIEKYDKLMREADWAVRDGEDLDTLVNRLHNQIVTHTDASFPWKNYKIRSTDDPWIDDATRKKIAQRKLVFERDKGRSVEWRELKAITNNMIKTRKKAYYAKECEKLKTEGAHNVPYKALKSLSLAERPPPFDPRKIKPHLNEGELLEDMATYFASISEEFAPLDRNQIPSTFDRPPLQVSPQQVLDRLVEMNKPKTSISIDPLSRFVACHADLYAPMIAHVINAILKGGPWPTRWSEEEVSIIPKAQSVDSYDGCRNISCTSIFSKLAETFMLDCLMEEVTLQGPQYGGLKGSGPPHLLAELLTKTMEQLDDNRAAVNLISLDFQKAFNRMDHAVCLRALASRGASNQTLAVVASFLSNRSMKIKLGEAFSTSRQTPGGAPQGTKAGNFLFCASVDGIDQEGYLERVQPGFPNMQAETGERNRVAPDSDTEEHVSHGSLPNSNDTLSRYGLPESVSDTFGLRTLYARVARDFPEPEQEQAIDRVNSSGSVRFCGDCRNNRRHRRIEDSDDEENGPRPTTQELTAAAGLPPRWQDEPLISRQYIDDMSGAEKVATTTGIRAISQDKERVEIHAGKSEEYYKRVAANAEGVGMKMNALKTQLLCVSTAINSDVRSFIYIGDQKITSGDELKLLGFYFGRRPRADIHIREIRRKFGARSWILRILKHASIPEKSLVQVYCSLVRPILEYPACVFHTSLTEEMSESLERLQRIALKSIFGLKTSYEDCLQEAGIPRLKDRRQELLIDFAKKAAASPLYGPTWFPVKEKSSYNLRKEDKYIQEFASRDRLQKAPIYAMRSLLNSLEQDSSVRTP